MTDEEIMATDVTDEVQDAEEAPAETPEQTEVADPALTVGRIVLWWRADRAHREVKAHPAIVTAVYAGDVVDLVAFATPMGSSEWRQGIPKGGPERPHSWSWPPRVGL